MRKNRKEKKICLVLNEIKVTFEAKEKYDVNFRTHTFIEKKMQFLFFLQNCFKHGQQNYELVNLYLPKPHYMDKVTHI